MAAKKYYWLKLKNDFFTQPKIKKLRRIAGGDTYTIIYLKLQLLSLKDNGKLYFEGIEENFAEEIALTIDEEVENVKITLGYLQAQGLIEQCTEAEYLLPETLANVGSETKWAEKKREYREKQRFLIGQSADNVQQIEDNVRGMSDKRKRKEKEIEKEREREGEKKEKRKRFSPPTREEVQAYISEKGLNVDAERFIDYYTANGWKVGKNSMKDWKATVRNWGRDYKQQPADKNAASWMPQGDLPY